MQATRQKEQLNRWICAVQQHFDTLSKPQATVLALWSFATVILQSALLPMATLFLAGLMDQKTDTVRARLREFYKPHDKKKGQKRRQIDVTLTFAPLTRWVLSLWRHEQLAIALDPTLCRDRFACLAVSLVYNGGSIPLAWKIVPANEQGAWMPHWKPLLEQLALPKGYTVVVLTDRGLYQRHLFEQIQALGLHPVMRINKGGLFCPEGHSQWLSLPSVLPGPGHYYIGSGQMFKTDSCRLGCTLIALWQEGYDEAWYLVSDLAHLDGACYGLRSWIEHGFRCIKSGSCHWEQSRICDCERMERVWLVYALSLLWTQSLAGAIEAGEADWLPLSLSAVEVFGRSRERLDRRIRRSRLGGMVLLLVLIKGHALPLPRMLSPDPWPEATGCERVYLLTEHLTEHRLC